MTLQTILDRIALHDNQLDLVAGGDDVVRGLACVNLVQDWFEALAASYPEFLASHNLLYTAQNTETTDWPVRLLRLDSLWYVDADTGRPVYELDVIPKSGGQVLSRPGILGQLVLTANQGTGAPREFTGTGPGGQFYWSPLPDAEYWIRAYGLWTREDYTLVTDTFAYPDNVSVPLSMLAAKVFKAGLDRDLAAIEGLAAQAFGPAIKALQGFMRTEPTRRVYEDIHDT